MPSIISIFEMPLAKVNVNELIKISAFSSYPWGDEPPLTIQEVKNALQTNNLIAPGIFSDDPVADELHNIDECSREQHVARIAWIISHYDVKRTTPISLSCAPNVDSGAVGIANGNHLLAAEVFMRKEIIQARFIDGISAEVIRQSCFISWDKAPAHDGFFGANIISTEKEHWTVDVSKGGYKTVWIGNFSGAEAKTARLRLNGIFSMSEVSAGQGNIKVRMKEDATLERFLSDCDLLLSPIFSEFKILTKLRKLLGLLVVA